MDFTSEWFELNWQLCVEVTDLKLRILRLKKSGPCDVLKRRVEVTAMWKWFVENSISYYETTYFIFRKNPFLGRPKWGHLQHPWHLRQNKNQGASSRSPSPKMRQLRASLEYPLRIEPEDFRKIQKCTHFCNLSTEQHTWVKILEVN